jgi:hypothetical protein
MQLDLFFMVGHAMRRPRKGMMANGLWGTEDPPVFGVWE